MFEGKEAFGKEVPNRQVLASDENTDFSRNVADSSPIKDAILFLESAAIQKAFWKYTLSLKDSRHLVNSEKLCFLSEADVLFVFGDVGGGRRFHRQY